MTPKFDDFLTAAIKEYAVHISPEVAKLEQLAGAHDTLEKAQKHLQEAVSREQKAGAFIREAEDKAKEILQRAKNEAATILNAANSEQDRARRERADAEALKLKVTGDLAEKDRRLQQLKQELDIRQIDVERRERATAELEAKLSERQRKLNAAMA